MPLAPTSKVIHCSEEKATKGRTFLLISLRATESHLDHLRRDNVKVPTWHLGLKQGRKIIKWDQWIWKSFETESAINMRGQLQSRGDVGLVSHKKDQVQGGGCRQMLPLRLVSLRDIGQWDRKGDCEHRLDSLSVAQRKEGPWPKMGGNQLDRLIANLINVSSTEIKWHFPDDITCSETGLLIKQTLVGIPETVTVSWGVESDHTVQPATAERFSFLDRCYTSSSLQTSHSTPRPRGQGRGSITDGAGKRPAQHS